MRLLTALFLISACGDDPNFSKADVDNAMTKGDYEAACQGVRVQDDAVRTHATEQLADRGGKSGIDCICEAMSDGQGGWDAAILDGLKGSNSEPLSKCFVSLVEDSELKNRDGAVIALTRFSTRAVHDAYTTLLTDESLSADSRIAVIESLPRRESDAEILIGILTESDDFTLQAAAAQQLASDTYSAEQVEKALYKAAEEGSIDARVASIEALRARNSERWANRAVQKMLEDKDEDIRVAAFNLLSGTMNPDETEMLVSALTTRHDKPETRDALLAAVVASGKKNNEIAREALCEAVPYWFTTYLNYENFREELPDGFGILDAVHRGAMGTRQKCVEDLLKESRSDWPCFADYYLKYWYVDSVLAMDLSEYGTDKPVDFKLQLDPKKSKIRMMMCK